jgi:hypothetical protein
LVGFGLRGCGHVLMEAALTRGPSQQLAATSSKLDATSSHSSAGSINYHEGQPEPAFTACRNRDPVGLIILFFIPALWQGQSANLTLFSQNLGDASVKK